MAIKLRDDEHIIHRSWLSYVILGETFLFIAIGLLFSAVSSSYDDTLSIAWLLFVIIDAVKVALRYSRTRVVVTNQRLLAKYGALFRETVVVEWDDLSSVFINQGFVGRWFNYGTITINTKGGRYYSISTIYQPYELEQAIAKARTQ